MKFAQKFIRSSTHHPLSADQVLDLEVPINPSAFTCGGLLSTLPIRLFMFYRCVVILTVSLFFGLVYVTEQGIIPWMYVNDLIKSYFCQDGKL